MTGPILGSVAWRDLTVADAPGIRDFYSRVVGWTASPVDMGGYSDFNMVDSEGNPAAGICHARDGNAGLPPQWLVYILVEDVEASAERCRDAGGEVLVGPKAMGTDRLCVIRDPAGAVCALYQKG
ncbi:MAG: VOC family protein [Longimicrobiales bacterium]|nr:VOC family protein [Longimicrobiales bacterium]